MAPVNSLINKYEQISRKSPSRRSPARVRVKRYDMPFRQSTLSFGRAQATPTVNTRKSSRTATPSKQVTPPAEDLDEDTIVVKIPDEAAVEEHGDFPLPTPSESVTDDISIPSSDTPKAQSPVKSRSKRVSQTLRSSDDKMLARVPSSSKLESGLNEKLRNISGDTLVANALVSQTSLVKDGIDKLDLKWNMDAEVDETEREPQLAEEEIDHDVEEADTIVIEEQQGSSTKQKGTKRVRIGERNQKWEDRKKTAEKNATRRSNRASLLVSKATEVISEITASVLGKRSRGREQEQHTSTPTPVKPDSSHPTKKARLSMKNEETERQDDGLSLAATNRALKSRGARDKKWLVSGLYAGQSRTFDPTKSEGQNKRKSTTAAVTPSQPARENSVLPLPMFAGSRLLEVGRDFRLPFDVFSPLPPGQPKPDEWRRVNKNVFVGDAAAEWRTNKFSEQSTCLCRPEHGCDSDCMNRFMYYECDSRNCNLTEEQCGNRAFEGLRKRVKAGGQYNVGVEVLRTADRGYGVRACRTFEPNQIIVEYTGEIINQEECESRMHGLYKDNECYYLMAFDQNMIIDATRGSIARFVNHSCDPNCRMEKWTVGGKPRMALFASDRGIMTGEELTYDYNFDPYSQKNVQVCRCGADNCRGVLGPKPKEIPKKEKESTLAGAKRKIAEVIEEGKEIMTGTKKKKTTDGRKKLPKGWVYLLPDDKPKSTKSRKKSENESDKKQATIDNDEVKGSLSRQPSKMRRMVSTKSSKTVRSIKSVSSSIGSKKKRTQGRRVISTSSTSSGAALIRKQTIEAVDEETKENEEWEDTTIEQVAVTVAPKRKGSQLKARAGSIKGKVGRSSKKR